MYVLWNIEYIGTVGAWVAWGVGAKLVSSMLIIYYVAVELFGKSEVYDLILSVGRLGDISGGCFQYHYPQEEDEYYISIVMDIGV